MNDSTLHWDNDCEGFAKRYPLHLHLGEAMVRGLLRAGANEHIIDCTHARQSYSGQFILALSLELAELLKKQTHSKRVGIVLPPGAGAVIANLACIFADKTPVNLNFTLSREALQSCNRRAGLDCILTAKAMQDRISDFPWTRNIIDVGVRLKTLPKWKVARWLALAKVLPAPLFIAVAGIPTNGGKREAALLFTSGSSGEPKGVPLTHANILGNINQISDYDVLHDDDSLMGCLPIFHSFGFTITFCFTIVRGMKTVYLPSPLETSRIARTIEEEKITVHLGTPTLFRPYLKKAKPHQLKSLRAVVAGAEKTPEGFHEKWEQHFGSLYLEGYGLTETTPVVACNIPGATRPGSVGKLFPGMAASIRHPDTGETQPHTNAGLLALQGVNVFEGYLNQEDATQDCIKEGWFITGDLARIDEDGYLYIEGRLSRFSKIGGEMVPHGTVEQTIAKALGKEETEAPELAISAREDEAKGEVLVLLTTFDLDSTTLRERVKNSNQDLPNMWLPREIKKIEAIPILGSGKLDLKALAKLAASHSSDSDKIS